MRKKQRSAGFSAVDLGSASYILQSLSVGFCRTVHVFFFANIQTTKRYAQELSEVFNGCFFFCIFEDQLHLIVELHASSLILYFRSFLDAFHRYSSPIIMICDVTSTSDVVKPQFREFRNTDPSVPPAASIV